MPKQLAPVIEEPRLDQMAAPTLQERKQELVRSAIWDAATDLFAEKGYDETTVDDIALKAGVSRRSFFRYFSSKSDLMAYGVIGYGTHVAAAIEACPAEKPLSEVFRQTIFEVAQKCAAQPRTRKIMQIAAQYPAAREAHYSQMAGLQERVQKAFASRGGEHIEDLTSAVVAGLTLSVLSVVFQAWFEHGEQDISATANRVLAALGRLACHDKRKSASRNQN